MTADDEPVGAVAHTRDQHDGGQDREQPATAPLVVGRALGRRRLETGLVLDLV